MKACVFFDRDGIVNRFPGDGKYVERMEDFHLQQEFFEALAVVQRKKYAAVIVTNQRGVALGRMSMDTVRELHDYVEKEAQKLGLALTDVYVCPHDDDDHPHRKPNPGMLLDAARKHNLDLSRSWMVGDSEKDVLAGQRAGCRTVLVAHSSKPTRADYCLSHMAELPVFLEHHLGSEAPPV